MTWSSDSDPPETLKWQWATGLPSKKSSVIYARQLRPLIHCVGGGCLPSKSYWLFMSDKHSRQIADRLSYKWLTCTVSVTCFFFSPLFTRWHRIRHCYIFIPVESCWYSTLLGTKTRGTCAGSGKHDLTCTARTKDSQRSKHCCSSEGKWPTVLEAIGWPQRAAYWAEGNLLKRSTSRPLLTRQVEKRCSGSI